MSGECNLLGSVSSQQKFEAMDIKALTCPSSWADRVIALRQISVTAQFYLENSRKIHPPGMRACQPKEAKRRERPGPLAPLFICFFLPTGLRYVNCASQECCLFYLVLTPVLGLSFGLPLLYFHRLPFLVF